MDLPCNSPDSSLFPKARNALKGQRFANVLDNQRNLAALLRGIQKNDFQGSFRQWQHLTKCIASQGEHFEGDSSHFCRDKQILLSQHHSGN
jgi:hypothetical protein